MKKKFIPIVFIGLFFLGSAWGVPVKLCSECSFTQMRNIAKRTISNGAILVYDPVYKNAYRFRLFRVLEPGFSSTIVQPKALTQNDTKMLDALYQYHDVAGLASKQVINVDLSSVPEFKDFTAYRVLRSGRDRNALSDWLRSSIDVVLTGGEDLQFQTEQMNKAARAMAQVVLDYLNSVYDIDLTLELNIRLLDGSIVVFDVNLNDGGRPRFNENDSRDADGNPLVGSANWDRPGSEYFFTKDSTLKDFERAVWNYGIPIYYIDGNGKVESLRDLPASCESQRIIPGSPPSVVCKPIYH